MTDITIGRLTLAVRTNPDLAEQLVAKTGCSPLELAAQLRRQATPFQIARVLAPMLDGTLSDGELAAVIDKADDERLRFTVADLLVPESNA